MGYLCVKHKTLRRTPIFLFATFRIAIVFLSGRPNSERTMVIFVFHLTVNRDLFSYVSLFFLALYQTFSSTSYTIKSHNFKILIAKLKHSLHTNTHTHKQTRYEHLPNVFLVSRKPKYLGITRVRESRTINRKKKSSWRSNKEYTKC